jgi:hypothetical protein
MTPEEKARELMLIYYSLIPMNTISFAKKCALIAVDEILEHCYQVMKPFWQEVKQEIEKL